MSNSRLRPMAIIVAAAMFFGWCVSTQLRSRLYVPVTMRNRTLVGFFSKEPPPWQEGNCFSLSPGTGPFPLLPRGKQWHVINMHAENFEAIVGKLGLESVEVERVGVSSCLIVDPRIPREWLRQKPCSTCVRRELSEELLTTRPDTFRY